jgi:hypothetical protein
MAAHAMGMGNVQRRAQKRVERLHLGESEGVFEWREARFWQGLGDKDEDCRSLGENAAIGDQRRHASLRVDREKVWRMLLVSRETDADERIIRPGLFQRNVRSERAVSAA